MGNQICLRLAAAPGTGCLLHEDNHILWHEDGAGARLSGIQFHTLAGPRGLLDPEDVRARVRTAEYGTPTSAIAVEQTHNRGGGAVWPLETLAAIRGVADGAGLRLHCDGARIWNAHVAAGVPLERYGALFDSLSVCFSKGLAAPVALERMVDRLAEDHANARRTAETVASAVPGSVDLDAVQTNMVVLAAGAFGTDAPGLVKRLADLEVLAGASSPDQVRLVFHYEVSAPDADQAARAIVAAAG